ncbi:DUF1003 domain-containing protein [Enterococcus sp. DIV0242_7C1]|uniref:Cyclic nucleotide-binding protein n=1 Tax=Candidatus Enterococcus dunnyi TaxID=1834192 RepID=A0A200ITF8_9ENTE|nr:MULTISPECIES: DUF1003 domain-containing protein [unclassified Enterococcus]MBO0471307.1 DUF1003 domain-containing protein [Enterococcus sp. DIV0242_7C1]OUZ28303.1 hypothetical protein A5889_003058 [Enterococcus sp. 9D6_DIV0238]
MTRHTHEKQTEVNEMLLKNVEEEIRQFILKQRPDLTEDSYILFHELLNYRLDYMKIMIKSDSMIMEKLNESIVQTIKNNETISNNLNTTVEKNLTIGQKTADAIAKFGGSWPFIFIFIIVLVVWIILNSTQLLGKPFDRYPFILLNLALSCLAAIQAPVIMMSQNRQEARDREQANNDYKVNLKAEIEVNLLHEKMDYLINSQWQHLVQMQHIQIELLSELQEQVSEMNKKKE